MLIFKHFNPYNKSTIIGENNLIIDLFKKEKSPMMPEFETAS